MMSSGIFGTVVTVNDDRVTLEVAAGTRIEVARAAIAKIESPTDVLGESGDA